MKISKAQIKKLDPCKDGYEWYLSKGTPDLLETLLLVNVERPEWARWLFTRLMDTRQRRQIAIFAAEQVLPIFEKRYPEDARPRKAIEAAKAVLANNTKQNREIAAHAAHAAAYAAYAAAATYAHAAAYAAYAAAATYAHDAADAAHAAHAAADAADAAAYAADAAAAADAADAAYASRKDMQERIIREAVRILDGSE